MFIHGWNGCDFLSKCEEWFLNERMGHLRGMAVMETQLRGWAGMETHFAGMDGDVWGWVFNPSSCRALYWT